jgi:hypothetical protein
MLTKTTTFLFFHHGEVFSCEVDEKGVFVNCIKNINFEPKMINNVTPSKIKIEKKEVLEIEKPLVKKEVKRKKIEKKTMIPNKFEDNVFSFSVGKTIAEEVDLGDDMDSAFFNYNIGYYVNNRDYLLGVTYNVTSFRYYGRLDGKAFNSQANEYLIAGSLKKFIDKSNSPYLRIDAGFSFSNNGEELVKLPTSDLKSNGLGANLGIGFMFSNIDIGIYRSFRSNDIESFTNLYVGMYF